jgi:AraC-like DNA-binding protein
MIYVHPLIRRFHDTTIFFDSLTTCPPFRVPPGSDRDVRKLKEFLDNHVPDAKWRLQDICKQLGLFKTHRQACRLFKACTGMGFLRYGKKRRLEFAARQLRTTDMPVKVVALDVGYRHVSTFTNGFTKYFQLCPTEFRRLSRENSVAVAPAKSARAQRRDRPSTGEEQ